VTASDRMTCPRCQRAGLAARNVRGARVQAGKTIPQIRMPVAHNTVDPATGEPSTTPCPYGRPQRRRT
jgi:hypothetical protein